MYTIKPSNLPKIHCIGLIKTEVINFNLNFFQVPMLCKQNYINSTSEWSSFKVPGFNPGISAAGYCDDQPILCSECNIEKLSTILSQTVVKTANTAILNNLDNTTCSNLIAGSTDYIPSVSHFAVPIYNSPNFLDNCSKSNTSFCFAITRFVGLPCGLLGLSNETIITFGFFPSIFFRIDRANQIFYL